jgi:hypothetical protein
MKKFSTSLVVLLGIITFTVLSSIMLSAKQLVCRNEEIFNDLNKFPHTSSNEDVYMFEWNITLGTIYEDRAIGVAVDSSDNIYVSGFQDLSGSNTNRDMVLVKYNPLGEQQWIRYWGGSNDDLPYDILIDSSDNIYVVGETHSFDDVDGDAVVIKYNLTGHQQWNFTWGGDQYDFANAIGIDSSNNFYIGGGSQSFADIDGDAFLVKFDENWIEQWNKTWGGSDNDENNYLHIDNNEDIYVAGASFSLDPSPGEADAFLNKYNSSGDLQWSQSWGGSWGQRALGIATDSLNDVYIVCRTFGHPASSGKGAIVKYNSTGNYQWEEIWGVNGVYSNYMYRIIIDSNDELYISGTTYSYGLPNNNDAILFNYDTDGNQNWYKIWSEYEWDLAFDLCMDSQSNIYLAGDTISYSAGQKDMLVLKYKYNAINIISPENKTYTEPMSGYYPATYGFENDNNEAINAVDWIGTSTGNMWTKIVESIDGHNKIYQMYDSDANNFAKITHNFNNKSYGTIEFWWRRDNPNCGGYIYLNNGLDIVIRIQQGVPESWNSYNGTDYVPFFNYTMPINTWTHIRLDFELTDSGYLGLAAHTLKLSIDGMVGIADCSPFFSEVNNVQICTRWGDSTGHNFWVDAVGFSWDSDYDAGDNFNEGLLLSYDSNLDHNWTGFSLDGQMNRTILGNTTFVVPTDGVHTIQVFGNNSLGEMYESDIRYFTINILGPGVSINSPTPNLIFGKPAPDFDLLIPDPDLDATWYSLDGGITNILFTGLTGTIDQTEWDKIGNGTATITFFANDTANNIGQAEVSLRKDIIAPVITVNEPNNAEIFEDPPIYDITVLEANLEEMWYTLDGGLTNITMSNPDGIISQSEWNSAPDGPLTIRFFAKDKAGNQAFDDVYVVKRTSGQQIPPAIPGYNIIAIFGLCCVITLLLIRQKRKRIE